MMSDLAAGSTAVRQLQQNILGAQYDPANIAAAAEEKQIQLQQDRLKPEEAQLKLDQERLKAQYAPAKAATQQAEDTYKLQEQMNRAKSAETKALFDNANYKADTESTQKLQDWMKTPDGQQSTDVQRLEKAAAFKAEVGLVKESAELSKKVEEIQAKEIANKSKQLANTNENIATARAIVKSLPDDRAEESLKLLPPDVLKSIVDKVGEQNWNKLNGKEKKAVLETLFQNAKQQVAMQVKEVEKEKAITVAEEATERSNYKADKMAEHRGKGQGTDSTKTDAKNFSETMKIDERLEKDGAKKLADLEKKVSAAEKVMIEQKAKWFNKDAAEVAAGAYIKAVEEKNNYAKQQLEKRIKVVESAPDYPGKQSYVDSLRKEMSLYGVTPIPVDKDKPAPASDKKSAEGKLEKSGDASAKTHDGYPARKNADGSYSTELSITVTNPKLNGGKPTNIPSLWKGKEVDEDTAVENALASGKKYDSFSTIPEAVNAAKERSKAGGAGATSNKSSKSLGVPPKEILDKANAAIQQGADPKEVLKRLQDKGYDVQFTKEK